MRSLQWLCVACAASSVVAFSPTRALARPVAARTAAGRASAGAVARHASDSDDADPFDDDALQAAFKAKVQESGGALGVKAKLAAKEAEVKQAELRNAGAKTVAKAKGGAQGIASQAWAPAVGLLLLIVSATALLNVFNNGAAADLNAAAPPTGQSARYETQDQYLKRKAAERKQAFNDADVRLREESTVLKALPALTTDEAAAAAPSMSI